jgi:hypothetical protein
MANLIQCPGCGLKLLEQPRSPSTIFNSSEECWQLYGELAAYNLSRNDPAFHHQYAVDAYEAQHIGAQTRNITAAFALIGLYLAAEHGYTGRQVQLAHMALGKKRIAWPRLEPPLSRGALTVQDVLQAPPVEERDAMLLKWVASVWQAWAETQTWVRDKCMQLLDVRV